MLTETRCAAIFNQCTNVVFCYVQTLAFWGVFRKTDLPAFFGPVLELVYAA